jgi:hypothetical protein
MKHLLSAVALLALGAEGMAQEPAPAPLAPTIPRVAPRKTNEVRLIDELISVSPIDKVRTDAVGLFSSETVGITADFWGESTGETLAPLIARFDTDALASVKALKMRIILAQLEAPETQRGTSDILAARLDYLIAAGALEQAEALRHLANASEPALYQRWFDVGLLSQRAERVCQATLQNMELAPSYAHRVFCLARDGRWFDAALTLNVGETLNLIDAADVELLQRFLDPELFHDAPPPLTAERLTPLRFVLYEALGEPRTIGTLPLAYLHADLQNRVAWRDRLEATERLVQSQAFGPGMLDFLYTEAKPAASGGIWNRVGTYQALRRALVAKDTAHLDAALSDAMTVFGGSGLLYALAKQLAPYWQGVMLEAAAADMHFLLSALAADGLSTPTLPRAGSEALVFISDILTDAAAAEPKSPLQSAVKRGLTEVRYTLTADRHKGESVLRALELLEVGGTDNPANVEQVLAVLSNAGLQRDARAIAVEILVKTHVSA